jgi:hypothetical protein
LDLISTTEAAQKMGHLIQLRATVQRAKDAGELVQRKSGQWHRKYTPQQAIWLNQRERELREFSATMKPRLV